MKIILILTFLPSSFLERTNNVFFPQDKVKQYFYSYLAEKQNGFDDMIESWNSSDHYYEKLSEEEKQRADRMVRNI